MPRSKLWLNDIDQGTHLRGRHLCVAFRAPAAGTKRTAGHGGHRRHRAQRRAAVDVRRIRRPCGIKAGDLSDYVSKAGQRYGSDAYFNGGTARGIIPWIRRRRSESP